MFFLISTVIDTTKSKHSGVIDTALRKLTVVTDTCQ